jgi:protoporphyrinogen oxidase
VHALQGAIEQRGGRIHVSMPVERIVIKDGVVMGVRVRGSDYAADHVISTVPTPFVGAMVPDLDEDWRRRYAEIANIGVICVLFKLKRSVTKNFWVNVTDDNIDVPGIVEFSNLRPLPCTVIYVPYYMPTTNPKWNWTDDMLAAEAFAAIRRINPEISESDRIAHYVGRLRNAQPICPPGFASHIPPMQTPVRGLQIADTCFYYPEDRGIAESVRLGKAMAMAIGSSA